MIISYVYTVYKIIIFYTLNVCNVICQLFLNRMRGGGKNYSKTKKKRKNSKNQGIRNVMRY